MPFDLPECETELVGGYFWGDEQDLFSALDDADFVALRLKAYF